LASLLGAEYVYLKSPRGQLATEGPAKSLVFVSHL
jgi:hypothetical protein